MSEHFDVVVIGSGSAAGEIASTCRSAGKSVALVDSKPFGGTCQLRGCDPKKVMVGAADLVDWARRMKPHGISGEIRIDWPELMSFKRSFTDPVPEAKAKRYAEQGIEAIHGRARFTAPDRISVNGRELIAKSFGIAAGRRPATLGIPGENLVIDSEGFLNLDSLPKRIVFIGGGYIAMEFAHLCVRAGSEVTVVNKGRPLPAFDADLVDRLIAKSKEIGIEFKLNATVNAVENTGEGFLVRAGEAQIRADLAVHAAGRVPDITDMDLEKAGVKSGKEGITVNQFLQSVSNSAVHAAGDCADTGNPALTPVAGWEGRVAAANMLKPESEPLNPHVIPSVVFTVPPLASVGLSEEGAKAKGLRFRCALNEVGAWYSSKRVSENSGATKVLTEAETGKILGAHLFGHQSEELINLFALAIRCGLKDRDLKDQIFAYPTHGSDVRYMI